MRVFVPVAEKVMMYTGIQGEKRGKGMKILSPLRNRNFFVFLDFQVKMN